MRVKLSDEDLIFLGGAAILGSMLSEARSKKEVFADALRTSTDLLGAWKEIGGPFYMPSSEEVAPKRRAKKAKKASAEKSLRKALKSARRAMKPRGQRRGVSRKNAKLWQEAFVAEKTAGGDAAHGLRSLDSAIVSTAVISPFS
jgi:hypothetical protein